MPYPSKILLKISKIQNRFEKDFKFEKCRPLTGFGPLICVICNCSRFCNFSIDISVSTNIFQRSNFSTNKSGKFAAGGAFVTGFAMFDTTLMNTGFNFFNFLKKTAIFQILRPTNPILQDYFTHWEHSFHRSSSFHPLSTVKNSKPGKFNTFSFEGKIFS